MGPGVIELDEAEVIRRTLYRHDATQRARIHATYRETLSAEDVAFYQEHGYLAMEGLLTAEEVEAAKTALSELIARDDLKARGVQVQIEPFYRDGQADARVTDPELTVRKVWLFAEISPVLAEIGAHPKLTAVLDQLIGPGHRMIQDMALIKPPFHGSEKPWHQDTAYFDFLPLGGIVGVWIALDAATVANGCMQVIPGSHLAGPTAHFHVRDCQLPDDRVQVDKAHVVPLEPGGVLFFSGLTHHGTPPNLSGDRRRALQYHYAAANCRNMTIQEHAELFSEGGAYAGCRKLDEASGLSRAVLRP